MNDATMRTLFAICGVVILDGIALCNGIDGTVLVGSVAIIAGLGGYSVAKLKAPDANS